MIHGLNNTVLYSAVRISCEFADDLSKKISLSGTAFFISVRGQLFLVTNRHVLDVKYKDPKYKNFSLSKTVLQGRFSGDVLQNCAVTISSNNLIFSREEINDFICIRTPTLILEAGSTMRIDYYIPEKMIATADDFKNDLSVCDFLAFPGYPEWYDQIETRPIFRGGTIASDPRVNYSYKKSMGDCVAYEAFSFDGSSGSPIFALQKGIPAGGGLVFPDYRPARFIGINAGHLPASSANHSGISYFFKSSAILAAIDENM